MKSGTPTEQKHVKRQRKASDDNSISYVKTTARCLRNTKNK